MANNVTLAFPPAFCQQFFDRNGKPLSGGRLYTFVAGTRTSIVTYKTIGSTSSANRNTNPIVLDSAGYANLVLEVGKSYRLVLTDRFGFVIKEWDNVTAASGEGGGGGTEYTAVQGVKVNGTELPKDGNNVVDVPVPTASTDTPLKDGTASAGSSSQWARGDHRHPTDDSREAVSNKKQIVNDSSTTEYPSSKAVADFVNSSVATNTANFLGTIAESSLGLDYTATNEQIALALNVHSWESTPTNNDYCFVSVNDPQTTDVDEYRRFKFNGSVWAYEYTLNNSSFTQAQWDAINSGLTSSDRTAYNAAVTLLNAHVADGSIHVTSSEKNAWNGKYTKPSTGIPKTDLASDVQTSLGKADTALQSHQSVTDNNPTLSWSSTSTVGTVGSTNLQVTMPSNPASGKLESTGDASNTTSTFTKASGDTSTMASGTKLSVIFSAISSFFASVLSALNNFKTKQTAVTDPTADGTGLSFIDSLTQNTNGEITPHKKTVQDGTTLQKGVVQLQDSIGSTESAIDKAATPHAVREAINTAVSSAYHAAGTKTVAQLTGSLLVAGNNGSVYNITDSGTTTSDFIDGAGHPINAGDNVGVCDVGSGVYKFDLLSGFVDLSNYLAKTGDASNTTSTLTKNASDTSAMTSGSKLSVLFTAISDFFASLKALAFKDNVNTGDIADDAITADKVKDNETLPVNISGSAEVALTLSRGYVGFEGSVTGYKNLAYINTPSTNDEVIVSFDLFETWAGFNLQNYRGVLSVRIRNDSGTYSYGATYTGKPFSNVFLSVRRSIQSNRILIYIGKQNNFFCGMYAILRGTSGWNGSYANGSVKLYQNPDLESVSAYPEIPLTQNLSVTAPNSGAGSASIPVYVDSNGQVQPCDPSLMTVGNATKWDGHAISIGEVSASQGTISIV